MSCVENNKLNLEILICIARHSSFSISEIEYAYNKLTSYDLVIEAIDYAMKNNLALDQASHDVKMLQKYEEERLIIKIIRKLGE